MIEPEIHGAEFCFMHKGKLYLLYVENYHPEKGITIRYESDGKYFACIDLSDNYLEDIKALELFKRAALLGALPQRLLEFLDNIKKHEIFYRRAQPVIPTQESCAFFQGE